MLVNSKHDLNLLHSFLIRDIVKLNWGEKYKNLQKMCYLLLLIHKKYKNPLSIFNIKYSLKKKNKNTKKKSLKNNTDIINSIILTYVLSYGRANTQMTKIDNISSLILYFRNKLTIWEVIDLIFNELFDCKLNHIHDSNIINKHNIEFQRNSYKYAIKLYILIKHNCISNINIFQGFN